MVEPSGPYPGQLVRAFATNRERPPEFCVIAECSVESVVLSLLRDETTRRFAVGDASRLESVIKRADICLWKGRPFAVMSPSHGALIVATGPAKLPEKLAINASVTRLEAGRAIEILADGPEQPTWHAFAIRAVASEDDRT